jgi:hypothetical protein
LHIRDDGAAAREERLALTAISRTGLDALDKLERDGTFPKENLELHRRRLEARYAEFTMPSARATRATADFRAAQGVLVEAQRKKLIELRELGKIDNTVLRRLQRVLDLQAIEVQLLETAGHSDIEEE